MPLNSLGLRVVGQGDGSLLRLESRQGRPLSPKRGAWGPAVSSICLLWAPEPEPKLLASQTEWGSFTYTTKGRKKTPMKMFI